MMTVKEVSALTGVSIRTLQYYDTIGLLPPARYTEAGYRLYDEAALERLQQILLFRELEFPLKDIKTIVSDPDFDRNKALDQQISLLTMKKEHLVELISFAERLKTKGDVTLDFKAFDKKKMDEYAAKAKEQWGKTKEYKQFEEKSKGRSEKEERAIADDFMLIFKQFGEMKELSPASDEAQQQVKKLQEYITEHYYTCNKQILASLGQMYDAGGEMTENIDKAGGAGTANFAAQAIAEYCR